MPRIAHLPSPTPLFTIQRPCLGRLPDGRACPDLTYRSRCPKHALEFRGTTTQRGYGAAHQAARARLAAMMPMPCGYCGAALGVDWVAAHRIDGDPSAGWIAAHPRCNEGAKGRGGLDLWVLRVRR